MIGIRAAMFYLIAYTVMTVGAFGVTMVVAVKTDEPSSYDSYDGLAARSPGLAALLTIFLLSLAGIPPTVGFIAKVGVFTAAVEAGTTWLAILGVVVSVAAAFFYLRVIVAMYMRPSEVEGEDAPGAIQVLIGVLAAAVLILGVFPGLVTGFLDPASILRW
jgi:NADH-quinone oxidoreductase subunit N